MVLSAQQGQCGLLGMDSHSDGAGQKHLNVRPVVDALHGMHDLCGMSSFLFVWTACLGLFEHCGVWSQALTMLIVPCLRDVEA